MCTLIINDLNVMYTFCARGSLMLLYMLLSFTQKNDFKALDRDQTRNLLMTGEM